MAATLLPLLKGFVSLYTNYIKKASRIPLFCLLKTALMEAGQTLGLD